MGKWAGKYVIGLTGNIGTGKSVVRRMLEHLGAYGIDADTLGHRAIAKGAPGYQPVLTTFGRFVLAPSGEIDRARLGRIVFNDPEALTLLEQIVHPLVEQAVDMIIRRASQPVIVIEAIKLLESNLFNVCDSVWVAYAPPEVQLVRLMHNRHMSESEARMRISTQPSQELKRAAAKVVIKNFSTYEDTWRQVVEAWKKTVPVAPETAPTPVHAAVTRPLPVAELIVTRGRPRHSLEIAQVINRIRRPSHPLRKDDVMAAFGEKAFLLLQSGQESLGVIGWQVENLVSRTTDIVIDPALPLDKALPALVTEMERASKDLQCEASLVFAPPELARYETIWRGLGYERRNPQSLSVLAWQEAAQESMQTGAVLYFKQLRVDRILRPI
ncbi:MAG TPA: dephospho-CoA kinase [Anaerolineaceae bacterium]|nr:dephospho-CoA kinase [Anaerolineaceae bacterium]